ncbi:hypothetical protein [Dongia sp.]|uniref:hypothetical protein n=1 Tax=Dongia sp. TaxID=1977262 RepID=UPI003752C50F
MPDDPVAADVERFIAQHIESIAQLEALLLLHDQPEQWWTPARVAERVFTNEKEMQAILSRLCAIDLIVCKQDVYRYERRAGRAETVDRLAEAYRGRLVAVTNLVHAKQRGLEGSAGIKASDDTGSDAS